MYTVLRVKCGKLLVISTFLGRQMQQTIFFFLLSTTFLAARNIERTIPVYDWYGEFTQLCLKYLLCLLLSS